MFNAGQRVKIIDRTDGHSFMIGEVVTVIDGEVGSYRCRGETGQIWWTGDNEMEAVEPMKVVKSPLVEILQQSSREYAEGKHCSSEELKTRIGKVIYAVVNKDGIMDLQEDRDYARELKAYYGGKKAGVTIIQYAPLKEIR